MPSTTTMIASLFSALALLDGALAGSLNAMNDCGFPIWVGASRGNEEGNPGTSPIIQIAPGGTYTSSEGFVAEDDGAGISLKLSTSKDGVENYPYLLQVAVSDGHTIYNLSPVDGAPFINYSRAIAIPDDDECPNGHSEPGDTGVEWPTQFDCETYDAVYVFLC